MSLRQSVWAYVWSYVYWLSYALMRISDVFEVQTAPTAADYHTGTEKLKFLNSNYFKLKSFVSGVKV